MSKKSNGKKIPSVSPKTTTKTTSTGLPVFSVDLTPRTNTSSSSGNLLPNSPLKSNMNGYKPESVGRATDSLETSTIEDEDTLVAIVKKYEDLRGPIKTTSVESGQETSIFVPEDSSEKINLSKCFQRQLTKDFESGAKGSGTLQNGVIPVKVSFTMKGISRFVVGTCFKIRPGLIPSIYKDWGYIITGVDHTISSRGWETQIKTQYYPVK